MRIFSIGYGNRPIDEFIDLVRKSAINVVCDVRSTPYSARFPDFSRESFQEKLKAEGITYVFMGDVLGARPTDPDCYEAGRASYTAMAKSSAFEQGIERIEIGCEKFQVGIMCAEKDPIDCHRAILVTRRLSSESLEVCHINSQGEIESQQQLERRLLKRYKLDQASLFDQMSPVEAINEAYERRGRELAYDIVAAYGPKTE